MATDMAPSYSGLSLADIVKAIMAGKVDSFEQAKSAFDGVRKTLEGVVSAVSADTSRVVTKDHWQGAGATAFSEFVQGLTKQYIGPTAAVVARYPGAMEYAKNALANAQREIQELQAYWDKLTAEQKTAAQAQVNQEAQRVLNTLATAYRSAKDALEEVPSTQDLSGGDDGTTSDEDTNGDDSSGDEDANGDDTEGDDTKGDDTSGDEAGGGDAQGEDTQGGDTSGEDTSGSDAGGSDPGESGSGGSDPAGSDPGGSDPSGSGSGGSDPSGSGSGGGEPSGGGDSPGGGGSGGDPSSPGTSEPGSPVLPGAPVTQTPDGTQGIDVDGDGQPDIGTDGKPLPGKPLVDGPDGTRGLDVNGDGKPDIGPNGEILKDAPLAKGTDGFGVDVNDDGRPDLKLNGPISPGAPLVQGTDQVWGVDVDGDGVPDIGLDGRPLPGAKLVESGGLWGVDVNGDGVPDIGRNGELLSYDALATGDNGAIGVDVDGDGDPDILLDRQVLPDAPIVEHDGVRGLDVDGDGVADLDMRGRPLSGAKLVTVDGVTGVDVNGDGRPDIGQDGQILKDAPTVTAANGVRGIDLNGDGKPDIALGAGRGYDTMATGSAPAATAAYAPAPPGELTPISSQTAYPTGDGTFTASGIGLPQFNVTAGTGDPGTVLTSVGAPVVPTAAMPTMSAVAATPPAGSPVGAFAGAAPLGAGWSAGSPGRPETPRSPAVRWRPPTTDERRGPRAAMTAYPFDGSNDDEPYRSQTRLTESDSVWTQPVSAADSALGRPAAVEPTVEDDDAPWH
ncbi:hypothetical protein KZZ52_15260 [Dactylosporangium sp. AC04546]|uniref:hypothetical protein n=1 Tax=Dactylosporangium sp. AC04546 TaxID=2862460 RepID=UPI002E7B5F3A|nr:hypothetical protein [Dactylosporangium sp. AC04546]WVK86665.1 hypothetical protein KZZ52_15260 [Dactylosporangium sp. AC04546]